MTTGTMNRPNDKAMANKYCVYGRRGRLYLSSAKLPRIAVTSVLKQEHFKQKRASQGRSLL